MAQEKYGNSTSHSVHYTDQDILSDALHQAKNYGSVKCMPYGLNNWQTDLWQLAFETFLSRHAKLHQAREPQSYGYY
ncbi:MAG: hypothetical protein AAF228_03515 [Pseudomonadota bacterium]